MRRPGRWEIVETQELADCAVFRVSRALSRSPRDGGTHPFYRIDAADWVNVVAVTPADELVMVRQWRHGLRDETLEIPGGMVDPGELPQAAAARELLEETGFRGERVRPIGTLNPNPALFGNRVHTYLVEAAARVDEVRNPGLEETVVELVPVGDLDRRLRGGDVDHALVVAALHFWQLDRAARAGTPR